VRVLLTVDIRTGEEQQFEQEFAQIAEIVRGEPGNVRQALCHDPEAPSRYVIMSDWESRDAFHAFERGERQDLVTAPVRRHRVAVSMTVLDLLLSLDAFPEEGPKE
jgi:heme-degrading monooxygenase HmoA